MRTLSILLFLGLAVAATPAVADAPPVKPACIQHDQIYNWSAINDKYIVVENYQHKKVVLKLIGTCRNLTFHQALASNPSAARAELHRARRRDHQPRDGR